MRARELIYENASIRPLLRAFADSNEELVEASRDEGRFTILHSEIVETLSSDPSYMKADARRQKVYRASVFA